MKLLAAGCPYTPTEENYRIDTARRMRIEEYEGDVGLDDLKATIFAMASDPCWSAKFHGLVDFSSARLNMSANDVLRLALVMRQKEYRTSGWLAFVAPDSTTFGTVRMLGYWSRYSDRIRIFDNRHEAESWLQLNMLQVPPHFIDRSGVARETHLRDAI